MVHPALATVLVVIFLNLPATSFAACPAGQKSVASTQITNFCNTGSGSGDECYCMTQHSAMSGCPGINSCTYPPYYPDVTRARAIASLYIQHICRCPEKGGLDHWYNSGKTIAQIEADIVWIVNNERNNCACPSPKNWNTLLYRCTACPSGQYNDGSMNTYRTSCITTSYCSPRTTCGAGTYASSGSASANTVCSTCSSCGGGTYESSRCTSTSNRQCKTCSTCSASQYEISACTASSNRQCATCQTCGSETYSNGGCSGSTNRICSACLSCSSSQYETSACTATANRQCATCQTCGLGTYSSGGCTGTENRQCSTCLTCSAAEYETVACTATSNRQCVAYPTCAGFGSSCGATKHLKSSPGSITCASSTCEISECCNPNPTCNDFNRPVDDTSNDNDNDQGGSDDSASSRCDNGFHMKNNLAFICESNICSASECCELNVCVCPTAGGNGHSGTSCEEHDTTSCSSCPYGHKLSSGGGGSCVACIAGKFQEMRDFTGTSCSK